mmetsp:Transcript_7171/g.26367  ORF Transcript_7171/g.26367 Transcript_7171/m.26367 type:complete len:99 (-) Transcript_7171:348-644(-)
MVHAVLSEGPAAAAVPSGVGEVSALRAEASGIAESGWKTQRRYSGAAKQFQHRFFATHFMTGMAAGIGDHQDYYRPLRGTATGRVDVRGGGEMANRIG